MVLRSALVFVTLFVGACGGTEAKRVELPVVVDGSGLSPVTNNLGWLVTTTRLQLAARNLQFTIHGEMHSGTATWLRRLLIRDAYAHPGHLAGGEVTGELPGDFLFDFLGNDGASVGIATLLAGQYEGMNLTFRKDASLGGHTANVAGTASKEGKTISWTALVDVDEGSTMIGAPFELLVDQTTTSTIHVEALAKDPFEADTLYDDLDFGALDADGDDTVAILPGQPAHNLLRREIQVHDQYLALGKN